MGHEVVSMEFQDQPPGGSELTDYDRSHLKLYARLLDAAAEGADWREVSPILFGIDPADDAGRARRVHDHHLDRARWVSTSGYAQLLAHP
jgi:hypothetical protein